MNPLAEQPASDPRRVLKLGAGVLGLFAGVALLSNIGADFDVFTGLSVVVERIVTGGGLAAAYLLSAIGLGRLFRPLTSTSGDPLALQVALGLALQLVLSHLLGQLGLLRPPIGMPLTLLLLGFGIGLLVHQALPAIRAGRITIERRAEHVLLIPGIAILLVAAANPPGWLWDSEFRAFDALSYHLQLPQEWLVAGRLAPTEHNVYSFLPGYVEAAFYHLAVLSGAPPAPAPGSAAFGLLAGDGWRAVACQYLPAGLTLIGAWLICRAVRAVLRRIDIPEVIGKRAGTLGAALFLATPWTQVVGSLAYNEMGVIAFFAAAVIAALDVQLPPSRRGIVTGLLVGAACGCKPTAITFVAIPMAALFALTSHPREWLRIAIPGAVAGLLPLLPWLAGNYIACGNPVFPYATGIFGTAHWTTEQVTRFAASHHFSGSVAERVRLLFLPDPHDPAGARHRGLLHPQFMAFFLVVLVSAAGAIARRESRRIGIALAAMLVISLLVWLFTTHIQSRFLIPLMAPGAIAVGVAIACFSHGAGGKARYEAMGLAALVLIVQSITSLHNFAIQSGGHPDAMLVGGPSVMSGEAFRAEFMSLAPNERRRVEGEMSTIVSFNLLHPPTSALLMIGDSTPFYFGGLPRYHTTYDTSPLGLAIRAAPNDPVAWTKALRDRGIDEVLVNFAELERLSRNGWYDPEVTPDRVVMWLNTCPKPIREWPREGRVLVRLAP